MSLASLKARDLRFIFLRNLLLLTNGIIFSVVALLLIFGDIREGVFLGILSVINISCGLIQDIRAWSALQKLQLLTAPHVMRVGADGKEESVLAETIQQGDVIRLKIGDQVPCDSTLTEAFNIEINQGLITGESKSLVKKEGEQLLGGSIVTAGFGTIRVDTAFNESRIARMTGGIREYLVNASPIQVSVDTISTYSSYLLIASLIFVIWRGIVAHDASVNVVLQAGTMASLLVPQGIAFMVTIFFAFGAANLFKKHVLLQEVNATEKLGRIRNLCMDKTGTITENTLSVKEVLVMERAGRGHEEADKEARAFSALYIHATGDSSQTIEAIKRFLGAEMLSAPGERIADAIPFSSWRQYGAVTIERPDAKGGKRTVFAGPPKIFLSHLGSEEDKAWLEEVLFSHAHTGQRLLCFVQAEGETALGSLEGAKLSIVGVFVFYNVLREGIRDTIDFFQRRGVIIRIISGDNPDTTRAVAALAGIKNSDKVATGEQMAAWSPEDFDRNVHSYAIFGGVLPEQKKQIVQAFKKDGFTAMVGDGANDALAIKHADLGIAMWDGAPALRKLASVVLMNNSFSALPGGVELADNIIRYIEMFSSMFLNQTVLGFFLFIALAILRFEYPFTPFNLTLINYFTIGMPGLLISYWIIWPRGFVRPSDARPFLERVVPFVLVSSLFQTIGLILVFMELNYLQVTNLATCFCLSFILLGYFFFLFVPKVYQGSTEAPQIFEIIGLGVFELLLLIALFHVPAAMSFFTISTDGLTGTVLASIVAILLPFCLIQCLVAEYFVTRYRRSL